MLITRGRILLYGLRIGSKTLSQMSNSKSDDINIPCFDRLYGLFASTALWYLSSASRGSIVKGRELFFLYSVYIYNRLMLSVHPSHKRWQRVQNKIADYENVQNCFEKIQGYGRVPSTASLLPVGSRAILIKVTYYRHKSSARERFIKPDRDELEKNKLAPSVSWCPLCGTAAARYLHS